MLSVPMFRFGLISSLKALKTLSYSSVFEVVFLAARSPKISEIMIRSVIVIGCTIIII